MKNVRMSLYKSMILHRISYLESIKLGITQETIMILVTNLEYPSKSLRTRRLERLKQ